ncbi:YbaB/EbfC family nucleoid-associated protein [Geovibrio thiophilus]|uniref:Nucleoid-associated protein EP073_00770 n=1 Tax=Geovibrio thiophilus TaxID=139438 RepID=A0A410JUY4_9BACT|nr:YbaB/EbfC family nucleoid-associated protein [Geovibrio thiophilus]QAR31983.1 YbaB/EbfC family nucleoid-associated protein [Geovibrio thiophilus]
MNIQMMMKQAQKMQKKIEEAQAEAAQEVVEASAGGGMVTVQVNGKNELLGIKIEKDVVDPEDIEMLQDLVVAAVNEGMGKAQAKMQEKLSKITGNLGINLPGMF